MKNTFVLLGLAALSFVSFTNPGDKKVKETTYKVDPQQSKLVWNAKKVTGEHAGLAPVSSGSVVLDGGRLKGGSIDVNLKALTVTDLTDPDYNAKLTTHLKSDDFFSVEKHPTAKLVITSASPSGDGNYDVVGKLTIKGITNEVKFPALVRTDKDKLTATAKVTVDRTKYDIKFRSKNFFENLGDKAIDDNFTLDVSLVATNPELKASR
ncbi:YceI family protein [Larkinella humicola]|uniref:YceI family protein n=1 Tax=Larkinella humicola TaxID=2607654 RepID=A0A5N1JER5_9BACT|nr:YceI family protein [Larkinella humicola]KAA9349596.1 YceI family protein [Larkinella humicola]